MWNCGTLHLLVGIAEESMVYFTDFSSACECHGNSQVFFQETEQTLYSHFSPCSEGVQNQAADSDCLGACGEGDEYVASSSDTTV